MWGFGLVGFLLGCGLFANHGPEVEPGSWMPVIAGLATAAVFARCYRGITKICLVALVVLIVVKAVSRPTDPGAIAPVPDATFSESELGERKAEEAS